ncbi:MAG: hypothetical protein DMG57_40485 [Acidobacteria bacterium]|nr:MAG: hypothetical protein DMG57_40485 [Acidobacteriota bacterium]
MSILQPAGDGAHKLLELAKLPSMRPAGYTSLTEIEPLMIEIQQTSDGLWTMHLFDRRGGFKVIMPPSEFSLQDAKEKALISARYYMQKYAGDAEWTCPRSVQWCDFTPRDVIWET